MDKLIHLLVGFIIGYVGITIIPYDYRIIVTIGVVVIAIGKELYDKYIKKTYFDFFDMFATILGGWIGMILYSFIQVIK